MGRETFHGWRINPARGMHEDDCTMVALMEEGELG